MKKIFTLIIAIESALIGYLLLHPFADNQSKTTLLVPEKPLLKYTYKNLRDYKSVASDIQIDKEIKTGKDFTSYLFFFKTNGKKVSGLLNIPDKQGMYPVMVLVRGFVDPEAYTTGTGSQRVGEYFASQGFITVSPDFLGYGQSDKPSVDAFEDRFQTYTTVIDLLSSLKSLNVAFTTKGIQNITWDENKIGMWAHSNGGQIALSVAEITGFTFPLVVWAPVSKPFPYSILYYTDEFDDRGKALRKVLAGFERNYDAEEYSLTNYFDWIKAPIQLHQGLSDESVPAVWSDSLKKTLSEKEKNIEYFTYPGENHNFQNGSWPAAVERSLEFIKKNTK